MRDYQITVTTAGGDGSPFKIRTTVCIMRAANMWVALTQFRNTHTVMVAEAREISIKEGM